MANKSTVIKIYAYKSEG